MTANMSGPYQRRAKKTGNEQTMKGISKPTNTNSVDLHGYVDRMDLQPLLVS